MKRVELDLNVVPGGLAFTAPNVDGLVKSVHIAWATSLPEEGDLALPDMMLAGVASILTGLDTIEVQRRGMTVRNVTSGGSVEVPGTWRRQVVAESRPPSRRRAR